VDSTGAANPAPKPSRRRPGEVTKADQEAISAAIAALPPLTDDQIDDLCDVIINAREKRRRWTSQPT